MVTFKKYGNRRLYDTSTSAYVTQAEIAARVRAGEDVRVLDAKTGDDLTPQTLAQIIFEDRHAARLLPVPLLQQLIRMGDDSLAEFFGRYVSWALEAYVQARQGMGALGTNPFATAAWPGLNPLASILAGAARTEPPPRPAQASPASEELASLRREMEELKKSLRKPRR
ncbi:MAG TPA: polyhydroxyalkanoate synthesis regulator DNA-binding domain-containing protein [Myxococcales bacterium]